MDDFLPDCIVMKNNGKVDRKLLAHLCPGGGQVCSEILHKLRIISSSRTRYTPHRQGQEAM